MLHRRNQLGWNINVSVRKLFVTSLAWFLFLWYLFDDHWSLSVWLQTLVLFVMLVLVYVTTLSTIQQIHHDANMARMGQHAQDNEVLTLSTYASNIDYVWGNDQTTELHPGEPFDGAVHLEVSDCLDDSSE